MKTILTHIKSVRLLIFFALFFLCCALVQNKIYAQPLVLTVGGQTSGTSISQGNPLHWIITGLTSGATVSNQLWIDKNINGVIEPSIDLQFVAFSQTDGTSGGNGPGDGDGIANGIINTEITGEYFPIASYIFKTKAGTDSAIASFKVTSLIFTTFTISGSVTKSGTGVNDITVRTKYNNNEYFAITNTMGNYIINTNIPAGSNVEIDVPADGSFNGTLLTGYTVTPNRIAGVLNANVNGANFVFTIGKVITGTIIDNNGNPISDYDVNINPINNESGYHGQTNSSGKYFVYVDTGTYNIQFGNTNSPNGYLITYYNQKYISWNCDNVIVTASTDTVKNINATIYKAALITGTFTFDGLPIQGSVSAVTSFGSQNAMYQTWYNSSSSNYYLYVLPGTYSIFFQRYNNSTGLYYNQSSTWPGTTVTVNNVTDVINNINVNFSSAVPIIFSSINASLQNNQVVINWTLATEVNGKKYIIERSSNGQTFYAIGEKTATALSAYNFVDTYPLEGINFYRVQAIDNEGIAQYSDLVNIKFNKSKSWISIYPSPATNNTATIQLNGFTKGNYNLKLYNSIGQLIYTKEIMVESPLATFSIALPFKGVHTVEISGTNSKVVKKLIVQ